MSSECAIQLSHPVIPFFCLQSCPASASFPMSQLFPSLLQVAKVLEFQLQHQFFQWIFRAGILRIDRFDHLAVQRTIKTLLQYHSLKASIPQSSFTFHFHALKKEMATHSSVLAWRILGMREPGGLQSMGSHRVGHDWSNLAAAAATAFFMIQLSYPHMITGKITALTIWTIGSKVMSLLFNTLSRFVSFLSQEAHIF